MEELSLIAEQKLSLSHVKRLLFGGYRELDNLKE